MLLDDTTARAQTAPAGAVRAQVVVPKLELADSGVAAAPPLTLGGPGAHALRRGSIVNVVAAFDRTRILQQVAAAATGAGEEGEELTGEAVEAAADALEEELRGEAAPWQILRQVRRDSVVAALPQLQPWGPGSAAHKATVAAPAAPLPRLFRPPPLHRLPLHHPNHPANWRHHWSLQRGRGGHTGARVAMTAAEAGVAAKAVAAAGLLPEADWDPDQDQLGEDPRRAALRALVVDEALARYRRRQPLRLIDHGELLSSGLLRVGPGRGREAVLVRYEVFIHRASNTAHVTPPQELNDSHARDVLLGSASDGILQDVVVEDIVMPDTPEPDPDAPDEPPELTPEEQLAQAEAALASFGGGGEDGLDDDLGDLGMDLDGVLESGSDDDDMAGDDEEDEAAQLAALMASGGAAAAGDDDENGDAGAASAAAAAAAALQLAGIGSDSDSGGEGGGSDEDEDEDEDLPPPPMDSDEDDSDSEAEREAAERRRKAQAKAAGQESSDSSSDDEEEGKGRDEESSSSEEESSSSEESSSEEDESSSEEEASDHDDDPFVGASAGDVLEIRVYEVATAVTHTLAVWRSDALVALSQPPRHITQALRQELGLPHGPRSSNGRDPEVVVDVGLTPVQEYVDADAISDDVDLGSDGKGDDRDSDADAGGGGGSEAKEEVEVEGEGEALDHGTLAERMAKALVGDVLGSACAAIAARQEVLPTPEDEGEEATALLPQDEELEWAVVEKLWQPGLPRHPLSGLGDVLARRLLLERVQFVPVELDDPDCGAIARLQGDAVPQGEAQRVAEPYGVSLSKVQRGSLRRLCFDHCVYEGWHEVKVMTVVAQEAYATGSYTQYTRKWGLL